MMDIYNSKSRKSPFFLQKSGALIYYNIYFTGEQRGNMKKLIDFWDEKSKFIFKISVIAMIIAHGFCFLNLMYSHDSLNFFDTTGIEKVGFGRWLYPAFVHARQAATPWMIGVLSILYVSAAVVLVTKILELNKAQGVCVAILFSTSITFTALFCTYIFDADADCMALLLACFAVYAFKFFPNGINIIIAAISMMLCLALYQAYICVSIGLFIIFVILKSKEIKNWDGVLKVFIIGLKELIAMILAVILYVPMMSVMAKYYGVGLSTDYNGAGQLSSLTFDTVLNTIPGAYVYFKDTFLNVTGYNTSAMVKIYWLMLFILILSIATYIWINRPFWGSMILVIPCLILIPLALNAIFVVSFGTMHQLMIFAFCLVLLLPFIFSNITAERVTGSSKNSKLPHYLKLMINLATALFILFIGFNNVVYSNGAYTYKKLVYDNTALNAQTIWKDINSIDGYVDGETQVVLMGDFENSKATYVSSVGNRYNGVLIGTSLSSITHQGTAGAYFYGVLGRSMNLAYNDPDIQQNDEFISMPAYPGDGYCKLINGKVIVKLN